MFAICALDRAARDANGRESITCMRPLAAPGSWACPAEQNRPRATGAPDQDRSSSPGRRRARGSTAIGSIWWCARPTGPAGAGHFRPQHADRILGRVIRASGSRRCSFQLACIWLMKMQLAGC